MEEFENRVKPPATKEQREAKLAKRRIEGELNLAALQKEQDAFMSNFERLKSERRARERRATEEAN